MAWLVPAGTQKWLRRRRQLLTKLLPWLHTFFFSVSVGLSALPFLITDVKWIWIPVSVLLVSAVFLNFWVERNVADVITQDLADLDRRTDAIHRVSKDIIKQLLRCARRLVGHGDKDQKRANLMMAVRHPDHVLLRIHEDHFSNMSSHDDRFLTLRVQESVLPQGCAGLAFKTGCIQTADISHPDDHVSKFHLDATQKDRVFPGMKSILSVPVRLSGDQSSTPEVVAILNIDSELPLSESGFADDLDNRHFRAAANLIAGAIALVLSASRIGQGKEEQDG